MDRVARSDEIEIYQDAVGQWRWRRRAPNGEIIADSGEGYVSKAHTVLMAARVNGHAGVDYMGLD